MQGFLKMSSNGYERRRVGDDLPRDVLHVLEMGGVPTIRQALPYLTAELERARRYMRPFSVVLLSAEGVAGHDDHDGHSGVHRFRQRRDEAWDDEPRPAPAAGVILLLSALLASAVREAVRASDIVSYAATQARCIVGLPEASADQARQAVERLQQLCQSRRWPPLRAGIAAFPKNGWTLEELFRHAESTWSGVALLVTEPDSGGVER
jgi:GGDEF domain-containing protein